MGYATRAGDPAAAPVVRPLASIRRSYRRRSKQAVHDSEERHAKVLKAALNQWKRTWRWTGNRTNWRWKKTLNLDAEGSPADLEVHVLGETMGSGKMRKILGSLVC